MKEQIIEILKQFEQTDYIIGGVSLHPEMHNAVAESIVKLFAISDVSSSVCIKCKAKLSAVPHPSKLCYECWKESKQTDR